MGFFVYLLYISRWEKKQITKTFLNRMISFFSLQRRKGRKEWWKGEKKEGKKKRIVCVGEDK